MWLSIPIYYRNSLLQESTNAALHHGLLSWNMSLYASGSSSKQTSCGGRNEFEILRASHKCVQVVMLQVVPRREETHTPLLHRFLREDEEVDESKLSWDDRLAKKYYDNLYREYAVCDLKHYKSGNVSVFTPPRLSLPLLTI